MTPSTAGCCTKGMRGATSGAKGINDLMPAIWRKYKTPDFAWVTDEQVLSTLRELTGEDWTAFYEKVLAEWLPKAAGVPLDGRDPGFPDVSETHPYYQYIAAARASDNPVTRAPEERQ